MTARQLSCRKVMFSVVSVCSHLSESGRLTFEQKCVLVYYRLQTKFWGKVMFLHMSVILSTVGKGSLYDVTSFLAAWFHVPSGLSVSGPMFLPGGFFIWSHVPRQRPPRDLPRQRPT